jgi:hypothetical protein
MSIYTHQMIGNMAAAPSAEAVAEFQKSNALSKADTGGYNVYNPNVATPGDMSPIRTESLEETLKVNTYKAKDIKLWPLLPKMPTFSAVDQHAEISSYSQNPEGGFFAEGGAPAPDDETYIRRIDAVKFIGIQKGVTHQLSLQRTLTSEPIALATLAGTMAMLRRLEMAALTSDSRLSALQTDGFKTQIEMKSNAENIIDCRGGPVTQDMLINAATVVHSAPNYGQITDFMFGTRVRSDIQRAFIPVQRVDPYARSSDGIVSQVVKGIEIEGGIANLHGNPFMDDGGLMPLTQVGSSQGIPLAPVISTQATTPAQANSLFAGSDAGNYYVWVIACNSAGKSAPVQVSTSAIALTAGQVIQFGVTPAPGSNPVEWYEIYRTPKNGAIGSQRRTIRVPNSNPANGIPMISENTIVDYNKTIPGTGYGFALTMTPESIGAKLLCPLLRVPLPIAGTTLPFLLLSYLCFKLYAPNRNVLFTNVGALPAQAYNNA